MTFPLPERPVPARLAAACATTPDRADWLARLPNIIGDLEQRWSFQIGGPFDGDQVSCAWVAPVMRKDGTGAVLKVGMRHMEGTDEIAGLRFWNWQSDGAIARSRRCPGRYAFGTLRAGDAAARAAGAAAGCNHRGVAAPLVEAAAGAALLPAAIQHDRALERGDAGSPGALGRSATGA